MKATNVTLEDARRMLNNEREFSSFINKNKNFLHKIVQSQYKKSSLNKNDSEVMEDLMQEAMLSLWNKALRKYTGETKFTTFAYTVVKNDLLRYLQDKTKFENKSGKGRISSLEEFRSSEHSENSGDYIENFWKVDYAKSCFEDSLIDRIDSERRKSKRSILDQKIDFMKSRGATIKQMADGLKLNIHSFKAYYYGPYKERLKNGN